MKHTSLIPTLIVLFIALYFWIYEKNNLQVYLACSAQVPLEKLQTETECKESTIENNETSTPELVATTTKNTAEERVAHSVPFTSQAPDAQWGVELYQEACEEASVAMAMAWALENELDSSTAKTIIVELAQHAEKLFGHHIDTSADDTARIIREYYDYSQVAVISDIKEGDLKEMLSENKIILAPANGQILNNPHYSSPGPLEHMIVIHGYDNSTQEFITHDPGTKFGANFRYSYSTIAQALWDYPTNQVHVANPPEPSVAWKKVIVISKKD